MSNAPSLPIDEFAQGNPKYGKRLQALFSHLRAAPDDVGDVWQFAALVMANARRSKAQLFQDLWAYWVSGRKQGGYFVEFGAAGGVYLSNTYLLEAEMGWDGILAEPNPGCAEELKAARRCAISTKCVYSASGRTLEFLAARKPEFSRIAAISPGDSHEERRAEGARTVSVQTISLDDLLDEHAAPEVIDFMSIDTEGSELDILQAFDFGRREVRAIAVEHNFTPAREGLYDLLSSKGYRRQWPEISLFDDWYVRG